MRGLFRSAGLLAWPGGGDLTRLSGAPLIVAACIAWGIDNNLTRKVALADPLQVAMLKGLVAGSVNLALALARGATLPALPDLGAALLVGFLGYGVSLVLFVLALRHLGTARTGAYFSTAPFLGAMLAVPLLGAAVTVPLEIGRASCRERVCQ